MYQSKRGNKAKKCKAQSSTDHHSGAHTEIHVWEYQQARSDKEEENGQITFSRHIKKKKKPEQQQQKKPHQDKRTNTDKGRGQGRAMFSTRNAFIFTQ